VKARGGELLIFAIEWNKQINMTVEELDNWLQSAKSKKAGWSKGDGSGEAIGHESYELLESSEH
jgi:phosphoribosyl-AMP cyclohydrolase